MKHTFNLLKPSSSLSERQKDPQRGFMLSKHEKNNVNVQHGANEKGCQRQSVAATPFRPYIAAARIQSVVGLLASLRRFGGQMRMLLDIGVCEVCKFVDKSSPLTYLHINIYTLANSCK